MNDRKFSPKTTLFGLSLLLVSAALSLNASSVSARPNCNQDLLPAACGGDDPGDPTPRSNEKIDLVPTRIQVIEIKNDVNPGSHQELAINVQNVGTGTFSPNYDYYSPVSVTVNGSTYTGSIYGTNGRAGGAIAPGETGTIASIYAPSGTFQPGQAVTVHIDTAHALQSGSGVFNNDEATLPIQ